LLPETQASVALPLMAGGRVLGAVAASFPEPRLFEPDERAFLLTLADQAAVAFERARLADVRREMADTLQRSLLPGAVPQPDRLAVAARYLPAVAGTAAGGDWFDVLPLRDGRIAVAVGDVVGHGAPAAAIMGQLRSSLAALLFAGCTPAPALELLDGLSARIAGARVTTVACLLLDPATGELTYSRAGHPPPLVTDRSTSVFLDGGLGPALGLPGTGRRTEAVTTLTTGATLLLFTDGLIEARDADLDRGLARLAAAVDACRTAPVDALVDGVLTAMVAGTAHDDDIALVALRPLPAPLDLRLPADPTQLGRLRRAVEAWATDAALPVDAAEDLQLAVGEAAANAVEHAYRAAGTAGQVRLELTAERGGGVGATVTDAGSWRPPPADPGFRGRGLQIIEALATDVDLDHRPNGTALRFRLPPARPQPAARQPVTATRRAEPAQLRVTDADGRRCLELVGDLDLIGVEAVRGPLLAELTAGRPVVLDLTRLGYVTSVGAGLLLEAAQTAAGDLQILPPAAGPARRLLDLTGLTGVLHRGAHSRLTR
jgi:anti-anti-sigma factor